MRALVEAKGSGVAVALRFVDIAPKFQTLPEGFASESARENLWPTYQESVESDNNKVTFACVDQLSGGAHTGTVYRPDE